MSTDINVEIKVIKVGDELVIRVAPDLPKVHKRKHVVQWHCDDGRFEIRFDKNGSPFARDRYPGSKATRTPSGLCRTEAEERIYNYTVVVWATEERPPLKLDPGVDVYDDGGDGR